MLERVRLYSLNEVVVEKEGVQEMEMVELVVVDGSDGIIAEVELCEFG